MTKKTAVIIGAGPAGLTAAYELLTKTDIKPIIFEMSGDIGGISRTIDYKGNKIDIGGHRFFSKSDRVIQWWLNIFPLQKISPEDSSKAINFTQYSKNSIAPDPDQTDKVMLMRNRVSRIFFLKKFFNYPLSLSFETAHKLGAVRIAKIVMSYLKTIVFPVKEVKNLEDFFISRFGKELYLTFFKDYTHKVWGAPCKKISAEWGLQRVKGLSIGEAVRHALRKIVCLNDLSAEQKRTETSLIERFMYPKYGPGQLWQEVARIVKEKGGLIYSNSRIIGIDREGNRVTKVRAKDEISGEVSTVSGDYILSSMPVKHLIGSLGGDVPADVKLVAESLLYRDFITVGLLLRKLRLKNSDGNKTRDGIIPDNWIYIQDTNVKIGRVQIFNNWSPYMVKDKNNAWIGLEYFCNAGDQLWTKTDTDLIHFAIDELVQIGFVDREEVLDSTVIRTEKAYPAYCGAYEKFYIIKNYTDKIENLFLIGRNGMHRYNNTDHSMLTAIVSVENIKNDVMSKENIWTINTEGEYHEK